MSQVRAAMQPRTLGRYNLIERLGVGGQGEVWRAHDGTRGVDVALKILAPALAHSAAAWDALEQEHAISERLQHAAILRVEAPERIEGHAVLPMELAEGGNLSRLRGKGYLAVVPVLLEVAEALEHAHRRGVVHRDLKPGNVLFDGRGRVKIADFGIAALLPGSATQRTDGSGERLSPFTASPAQLRGEPPSPADDIYGFGALAYELLGGHPPHYPNFDATRVLSGAVPQLLPTRQAPQQLIELVMRMLAKCADERPASMAEAIDELEATLNSTLALDPIDLQGPPETPSAAAPAMEPLPRIPTPESPPAIAAVPPDYVSEPASRDAPASLPASSSEPGRPAEPTAPFLAPMIAGPERLSPEEILDARLRGMPQRYGRRPPEGRGSLAQPARSRSGARLGYLLFGLVCGAMMAVVALNWLSGQDLRGTPMDMLSTLISRVRERVPASPQSSPRQLSQSSAAPAHGAALGDSLGAQRAQFDRRLSALQTRGAAIWDASDFAAAKLQAAETNGAEEAGGIAVARQHWQRAEQLLSAMEAKAPQALTAQLRAGQSALAAGHQGQAAQAFALALRIEPASRRAMEGAHRARLLASAHHAQPVHHPSRAAPYVVRGASPGKQGYPAYARRVQVVRNYRDTGYAKAVRAGLTAFGNGRLYEAQADFQQALVYRPQGIEASTELNEVNAALRARTARP